MTYETIHQLLKSIGPLQISDSPYDTAWVARLPGAQGARALDWIKNHQLPDGSWGAPTIVYPHERMICTLAALNTLVAQGEAPDSARIRRGVERICSAIVGLQTDYRTPTIGFELLAPALWKKLEDAGVDFHSARLPGNLAAQKSAKLGAFFKLIGQCDTPLFSLEAFPNHLYMIDLENAPSRNGSVSYSPSATAFYLLTVDAGNLAAMEYLHRVAGMDGSLPYVGPIEIFDRSWTLWNLALIEPSETEASALDPQARGYCTGFLDEIAGEWQQGQGVSAAIGLEMHDGDDTAMTLAALAAWGRDVDLSGLLFYESPYHFRCYPIESVSSVSTNVHALDALRRAGTPREHVVVQKTLTFLDATRTASGYWTDKWHISPYYPTAHAVIAAAGYANTLVTKSVDWLLATQREDGSWGMSDATAEETAYALQALVCWKRAGHYVPASAIKRSATWLAEVVEHTAHAGELYPPLWVGKSLYCPYVPVRAAVVSALTMTETDVS